MTRPPPLATTTAHSSIHPSISGIIMLARAYSVLFSCTFWCIICSTIDNILFFIFFICDPCLRWHCSSEDSAHSAVACLLQVHTGHYSRATVVYFGSYCSYGCSTEERVVAMVGCVMGEYPTRLPGLYSLPQLCTSCQIFLMFSFGIGLEASRARV